MSELKHTPGQWYVKDDASNVVVDSAGEAIAEVWVRKGFTFKANANLIAAAPTLYDSLYEILHYTGGADTPLDDKYVMDRAVTALAKAIGETP